MDAYGKEMLDALKPKASKDTAIEKKDGGNKQEKETNEED